MQAPSASRHPKEEVEAGHQGAAPQTDTPEGAVCWCTHLRNLGEWEPALACGVPTPACAGVCGVSPRGKPKPFYVPCSSAVQPTA